MTATAERATTQLVPSYVMGSWWTPEQVGKAADVFDASTGETLFRVSTDGLDIGAVIDYGRTVGQRNLATMTIHERALVMKELAIYLGGRKKELYAVSLRTGATKVDNFIDIDGGIGVLYTMSSKGRRELPNSNVVFDGPLEPLSKDGSFLGTHIYTPLAGVAVQINAFNFPVWGMLEKFAPAFVAGVPTIVKPATPTGYLTEACVRMMIESGLLPEGSLQLISGSARDLLDHLDYRDSVAFTGSASTANSLRKHVNVIEGGVRFMAEADSLNCAILGPDATPETPEFDAYVKSVVAEVTTKAGQKCTAIRRAIVPQNLVQAVVDAVTARITERVVVGDPRVEGVTMGALASLDQLRDVKEAVQRLVDGGGTINGSLQAPAVRTADGEAVVDAGAFMSPVILTWDDPDSDAVHTIEAFGPVTSVIGYTDLDDAVRLAAKGSGSLAATVCSNDPATVQRLTTGIAAHHGRVLVLNREDAKTSTGHGSPMPHLIHGGPGRAGGGEELGGVRAIKHHMQRTAVQGSPNMLTAITGIWQVGADRVIAGSANYGGDPSLKHPFLMDLAELKIGDSYVSDLRKVTLQDITDFANETGDKFYAHTDAEAAEANPFFPGIVAHGYLIISWAAGLFVAPGRGPVLANFGLDNLRFMAPVGIDDSIRVELTAKRITPRVTDDYGEVAWDVLVMNQNDEMVARYDLLTLVDKDYSG
ncbi:MAG: phenylacetic acid degradation bifunctional protein PaaZ [Actinobacteria bacterium]|nr:phenylacetic acid degradation bifunctional protein PaaZ [Actinomycetota bacterium]